MDPEGQSLVEFHVRSMCPGLPLMITLFPISKWHINAVAGCRGVENHSQVADCTRLILRVECAWSSQGMLDLEA